jgi:DNA-binding NarL/FixJ family response regulator
VGRPRLVIVQDALRLRLSWVDALRGPFDVHLLPATKSPLRGVREVRPDVALIGLGARPGPGLRLCLALHSERQTVRVAVADPTGQVTAQDAIEQHLADGLWSGAPALDDLPAFVHGVLAGARPVVRGPAESPRWWRRALGRGGHEGGSH